MPRQNKQSKGWIKFGLKMDENSDKKKRATLGLKTDENSDKKTDLNFKSVFFV